MAQGGPLIKGRVRTFKHLAIADWNSFSFQIGRDFLSCHLDIHNDLDWAKGMTTIGLGPDLAEETKKMSA